MTTTELADQPFAEQPGAEPALNWGKTAFVTTLAHGEKGDRVIRQLTVAADLIRPVIVKNAKGETVVGVSPTRNPAGMLGLLKAIAPAARWQLYISGTPIPEKLFKLPRGMLVPPRSPILNADGDVDESLTEAMGAAIQKLGDAHDVLETILGDASRHDDGSDDATEKRLNILRLMVGLEQTAAGLAAL